MTSSHVARWGAVSILKRRSKQFYVSKELLAPKGLKFSSLWKHSQRFSFLVCFLLWQPSRTTGCAATIHIHASCQTPDGHPNVGKKQPQNNNTLEPKKVCFLNNLVISSDFVKCWGGGGSLGSHRDHRIDESIEIIPWRVCSLFSAQWTAISTTISNARVGFHNKKLLACRWFSAFLALPEKWNIIEEPLRSSAKISICSCEIFENVIGASIIQNLSS